MKNKEVTADICIIGGGLAGLVQSLLLAHAGLGVICVDAQKGASAQDERTTAISYGSSLILERAGVWEKLKPLACPIRDIKILDGRSSVLLDFAIDEVMPQPDAAFGWILTNTHLKQVMEEALENQENVRMLRGLSATGVQAEDNFAAVLLNSGERINAKLVIGADGRRSRVRELADIPARQWDYGQKAIVCIVTHENAHDYVAVEHFRREGPFAILPMTNNENGAHRSSVVWTIEAVQSHDFIHKEDVLIAALSQRFPPSYGALTGLSSVQLYPLGFSHAYQYTAHRTALVADAAHGIHPIAGQGLNIGLRDVDALAKIVAEAHEQKRDIGAPDILQQYDRSRKADNTGMAAATDMLNKLFSNDLPGIYHLRKAGLRLVSRTRPVKEFFMKQAMGKR
jgi:2-octaprenyl-6-methoxyphenol hydroxylase